MNNVSKACHCTVCHLVTHSIAGTTHRRCAGRVGAAPRKHQPHAKTRGLWRTGSVVTP
jgi:hypothetical protein